MIKILNDELAARKNATTASAVNNSTQVETTGEKSSTTPIDEFGLNNQQAPAADVAHDSQNKPNITTTVEEVVAVEEGSQDSSTDLTSEESLNEKVVAISKKIGDELLASKEKKIESESSSTGDTNSDFEGEKILS